MNNLTYSGDNSHNEIFAFQMIELNTADEEPENTLSGCDLCNHCALMRLKKGRHAGEMRQRLNGGDQSDITG